MSTPEIAALLRAIADVIESSNPPDVASVTAALTDSGERGSKSRPPAKRSDPPPLASISEALLSFADRDVASRFLAEHSLTKKDLTALARDNNVHVTKEDNMEKIESRIIEALVGSRLNSRAIRGEAATGK